MNTEEEKKRRIAKIAYSDIIAGHSSDFFHDRPIHLQHLRESEIGHLDIFYERCYEKAAKEGLPSEEEKIKILETSGDWTRKEEERVIKVRNRLRAIKGQIDAIYLQSQKRQLKEERSLLLPELKKLEANRSELVGITCESHADGRRGEELIRFSLHRDKECKIPFITREDFNELDHEEFLELIKKYNDIARKFSIQNFKRIASQPYFLNHIFYCKDNPYYLYGKPLCELTIHQSTLFTIGMGFKNVIAKGKSLPEHLLDDVDACIEWMEGQTADPLSINKSRVKDPVATGIVGANKEELEEIARREGGEVIDLKKELDKIKKEKGSVNTLDFLKLHGIIPKKATSIENSGKKIKK